MPPPLPKGKILLGLMPPPEPKGKILLGLMPLLNLKVRYCWD